MFGGNCTERLGFCEGQTLAISNYSALFSILGTTYGGDGRTTFKLPDLRGRVPIGVGSGPGLEPIKLGGVYGSEKTTLSKAPEHLHSTDGTSTGSSGGAATLSTTMPSLGLTPVVATQGIYPARNLSEEPSFGDIAWFAGSYAPRGWATASGQLLSIAQNTALFSLFGTTYGGDGRTTFALPDLRGRIAIGAGQGPGLSNRTLGQRGGQLEQSITLEQTPRHQHNEPDGDVTGTTGKSYPISIEQPWLALNFQVALEGIYPARSLEEQHPNNGTTTPDAKDSERFLNGEQSLSDRKAKETITPLLDATRSIWERAGANQRQLKTLDAASIHLSNLDSGLAEVRANDAIHLDRDAQGRGWFVDPTPLSNSEYNSTDPASGAAAAERGAASRHYDLLTTLLHEQAHLLGLNHVEPSEDLMHGGLSIGIRKTPGKQHVKNTLKNEKPDRDHQHALSAREPYLGAIGMSGINFAPRETALAEGQLLSIANNSTLFSLLGTFYDGDGRTSFGLPDYRGRAAVGKSQNKGYPLGMRSGRESLVLTEDQLPAHSHSEPSLGNILGLDQESTDAGSKFTLQSSAVIFEPFTNNGTLTNASGMSLNSTLVNTGTLINNSTININKGGKLTNEGTLTNTKNNAINNNGTLDTSNGNLINQGTISGSGTLSGHYVDQGKIDPGNSTGGIELDGHFAKNKGVTVIELAGYKDRNMNADKTKHDFLDIKGDAQLGGRLKANQSMTIFCPPGKIKLSTSRNTARQI